MTRNRLMQPRAPLQPLSENERHKVDYNVDQLGMDDFAILSDPRNVQTRRAFADRTRALGLDLETVKIMMDKRHPRYEQVMNERRHLYAIAYPGYNS